MTHTSIPQQDSRAVVDPVRKACYLQLSDLPQDSGKYFFALALPGPDLSGFDWFCKLDRGLGGERQDKPLW